MKSRPDLPVVDRLAVSKVPAWARPRGDVQRDVDAGYLAGAALNSLDNLVRSASDWAGVWRHRLALRFGYSVAGRKKALCATPIFSVLQPRTRDRRGTCSWPGGAWPVGRLGWMRQPCGRLPSIWI